MLVGSGVDQLTIELRFYQLQAVVLRLVVLTVVRFQLRVGSVYKREVFVLCLLSLGIVLLLIFVYIGVWRLRHLRYHQRFQKREGAQKYCCEVPKVKALCSSLILRMF